MVKAELSSNFYKLNTWYIYKEKANACILQEEVKLGINKGYQ